MFAPEEKPHFYQRVMIAFSVLGAGLYGLSFFHRHFRVLYDKYLDFLPVWLIPVSLLMVGFTFGMALGGMVAPESFWKSRTGKNWLLVGESGDFWWQRLLNRWKCLLIVAVCGTLTAELIRLVYIDY